MIRAAEKAARSLVRDFGEVEQLQVSQKGPGDFVSAADMRAEEILYEELSKARPDFGFIMEEKGKVEGKDTENNSVFIIDPLDGTTNFLHGLPHWAISIGLEENNEITAGVIYDPIKDEMFTAEKGQGAFFNRRKRLRVSSRSDPMLAAIATGAPRRTELSNEIFSKEYEAVKAMQVTLRRFGAASLDMAYVAAGRYEGFWERSLSSWDIAAGSIIVKEAGGLICDLDKDTNNAINTGNILCANQELFQPLKKALKNA